jgi:TATA-box binding protein (TBP) (component of TFIID and TFIIIB)
MKTYQNELIVLISFLLMIGAFFFKQSQIKAQEVGAVSIEKSINETKEIVGLIRVWKDKKVTKKILKIKNVIASAKVKWRKKSNKVTASFKKLTAIELNRLVTKILNVPVQIVKLEIKKVGLSYEVEFKCKW